MPRVAGTSTEIRIHLALKGKKKKTSTSANYLHGVVLIGIRKRPEKKDIIK